MTIAVASSIKLVRYEMDEAQQHRQYNQPQEEEEGVSKTISLS